MKLNIQLQMILECIKKKKKCDNRYIEQIAAVQNEICS